MFVVNSPNVRKYARNYHECPTIEGMELENFAPSRVGPYLNSHWKHKNINVELMNARIIKGSPAFVSPMTLGLLEDSGWYKVNHTVAATPLHKGVMFGYQEGCATLLTD